MKTFTESYNRSECTGKLTKGQFSLFKNFIPVFHLLGSDPNCMCSVLNPQSPLSASNTCVGVGPCPGGEEAS